MGKLLTIHDVNDVRLDDYQRPGAGPADVVIRMKAVGICGSDLSYIKHGGIPAPGTLTALGHEGAGEVIEVGEKVSGVSPGQRVIVNPMMTPSYIGSGGPEGAFTEELLVRDGIAGVNILPIPEGVSYEVAAMCEPLAVALHGVNRAQAKEGEKIVIFGCGPIGLGMVLWAIDRGCKDVIALDLSADRLERAKALGAHVIDPGSEDVAARIQQIHGTVSVFGKEKSQTDAYIDAAGGPAILGQVVSLAKTHARHVITAAYLKPIELPAGPMLTTEMTITSAVGYPTEMPEVIAAMPRLKDTIAAMISHTLPFEEVIEGLAIAASPQSGKVMIAFGDAR
ncbi:alcohol dehydrogenase catalytic domain-containing protein [Novosphingobium sp. YJ-S2-02]|uniref:Alcohol dehydrogenase catalytic domain-containing protein n=1 Tax=Novosphingobium aureum TaxID=2792964 RepID=A0A931MMY5_9SPHN|nr:alcohol dehydrogenase catalytic domain-containing protein [Novosphingobium aureum]MBH0114641.1 alcohol dehydrogenase catalytic domain-containing protein [Novosphingobium aureum]